MRRGLSLVEVIVGVSLAGLAVLFLLGLLPSTALVSREAEQKITAARTADKILAHLSSRSFDELKAHAGTDLNSAAPGDFGNFIKAVDAPGHAVQEPTVQITVLPPNDRLLEIAVEIRWESGSRKQVHRQIRRLSSVR